MPRIAANGHFCDFVPLAFLGQVHAVHNMCRPSRKTPRKAVGRHRKFSIHIMPIIVRAEPIDKKGIVIGNCGESAEHHFAFRTAALALDEQDKAVELEFHIFGLGEMKASPGPRQIVAGPDQRPAGKESLCIASRCASTPLETGFCGLPEKPGQAENAAASQGMKRNSRKRKAKVEIAALMENPLMQNQ